MQRETKRNDRIAPMGPPTAAQFVLLLVVSLPAAWSDVRSYRIPDVLTVGGTVVGLLVAGILSARTHSWYPALSSVLGLSVGFGLFFAVSVGMPGKLGFGDVKYSGFLGACLGVPVWFGAVFISAVAGISAAVLTVGVHRLRNGGDANLVLPAMRLPFAPFLAGGAVAACLVSWLVPGIRAALF
jgi:prepilin signal peptidase PulO-like enzyme (type II secretory pathway)